MQLSEIGLRTSLEGRVQRIKTAITHINYWYWVVLPKYLTTSYSNEHLLVD